MRGDTFALVLVPGDMTYGEWIAKQREMQNEPDIAVHRSVGAKGQTYDVVLPDGDVVKLAEGTRITDVKIIAGKDRARIIDEVDRLVDRFGGDSRLWQKAMAG